MSSHPRALASAVALALAGFGAAAYGIASNGPDAADLPRRLVTESVNPEDVAPQLEALAGHALQLYRSDLTRSGDGVESLLARLGVSDLEAIEFLRRDALARKIFEGRAGKIVRAAATPSGTLEELTVRYAPSDSSLIATHFERLRIERREGNFSASVETVPLAATVRLGSGTIRSSLFAATDESGIPDAIAIQMAEAFSVDLDFHRELRKGDTFSVVYETLTADGEPITWNNAAGRMIAAEFVNKGEPHSAVWFKDEDGRGGYYDLNGTSKRRAFLASPMEFSRVTSGFSMRMHPILNQWRAHKGVDYGAPTGTPVRSVARGVVHFAGRQNGYGNVVEIDHGNGKSTLYAHLSRIDVRRGQRIDQGDRVGAVGATGWATGPHLHFEFKLNGAQRNPQNMAKSSEAIQLSAMGRQRFAAVAQSMRGQLDAALTVGATVAE
ncbi:M23 family metallopeptidase [uncultured Piscinibacter sp.]|uniref:M23 family metallopeptidase n=1 Tax=uncultured Piscinibacter sp. TaxID=1131835 RepID=UPI0026284CCA|nr:M23 family metallopeptidase [uncultured Piscinibacter sp.]